jgi:hypothetical protein
VTAAGTRPTDKRLTEKRRTPGSTAMVDDEPAAVAHHYESGRYTAPTPKYLKESPKWVPILMLALFVVGGVLIMARYLFWDSQIPMVVGMGCLLAGLYTATKWR